MSETALILDDSLTVRMDLTDAFTAAGWETLPCSTIAEARAILAEREVPLLVLDVMLPDGDGISFMEELQSANPRRMPVVLMLSTEADVEDRIRGLQTGADEYVGKPYDSGYVVARARELLRARDDTGAARGINILLIDDSLTFAAEIGGALNRAGYDVRIASSGEEGLRMAADHRPDVLIVDLTLPGIDGAAVIRRIRMDVALRHARCLLLTASDDESAELMALDAGADGFARKDADLDLLLVKLAAMVRSTDAATASSGTRTLLGPHKILAVDDSDTFLNMVNETLSGEGYDVILARSGEEALALLAVQTVDCVLLDLIMPGIGGREACQQIRREPRLRNLPIIMLTSVEDRRVMIECLSSGADDYLAKSGDFEMLKARLRAQIRRKQFEDENRRIREEIIESEMEAAAARAAVELAETRAALVQELEDKNRELEAFSYSVAHDLRGPLRSIDGFSQMLLEDCAEKLDADDLHNIHRVRAAAQRMGELIDDLLSLSKVSRAELDCSSIDLTRLGGLVVHELQQKSPDRHVECVIDPGMEMVADTRLMRVLLENLLGNAWKFSGKREHARIEFGHVTRNGFSEFFVRDNGAGFDAAHADKLFRPFQRLHRDSDFPGTGIGLATVQRIIERHGGKIWAESKEGDGATFWFTAPTMEMEAAA